MWRMEIGKHKVLLGCPLGTCLNQFNMVNVESLLALNVIKVSDDNACLKKE